MGGIKAAEDTVEGLNACPLGGCAITVLLDPRVAAGRAVCLNEEGDVAHLVSIAG